MNNYTYKAMLDRVVDGDTVDMVLSLPFDIRLKARLRLAGIDAPESRTRNLVEKEYGLAAKNFVKHALLVADTITVKTTKSGKFGRYIATIYTTTAGNTTELNSDMIRRGLATPYEGGKKALWEYRKAVLDSASEAYSKAAL